MLLPCFNPAETPEAGRVVAPDEESSEEFLRSRFKRHINDGPLQLISKHVNNPEPMRSRKEGNAPSVLIKSRASKTLLKMFTRQYIRFR